MPLFPQPHSSLPWSPHALQPLQLTLQRKKTLVHLVKWSCVCNFYCTWSHEHIVKGRSRNLRACGPFPEGFTWPPEGAQVMTGPEAWALLVLWWICLRHLVIQDFVVNFKRVCSVSNISRAPWGAGVVLACHLHPPNPPHSAKGALALSCPGALV